MRPFMLLALSPLFLSGCANATPTQPPVPQVATARPPSVVDAAALNAVKIAEPFPPVPDSVAKQALAINGQFVYRIREKDIR